MNNRLLLLGISVLLLAVGLSGCIFQGVNVSVKTLDAEPDNYLNMTEEQLEAFPHLKEAIMTNKTVETTWEEIKELDEFLTKDGKYCEFIQYQNKFYEIMKTAYD